MAVKACPPKGASFLDACKDAAEFCGSSRASYVEKGRTQKESEEARKRMKDPETVSMRFGVSSGGGQPVGISIFARNPLVSPNAL